MSCLRFFCIALLVSALGGIFSAHAAEVTTGVEAPSSTVYTAVATAMQQHANRQPGSPGYAATITGVEQALREAGVAPSRLEYPTLGLDTRVCRLLVDGVEIPGILPLAPNGVVPSTSFGGPLRGPLIWVGNGGMTEIGDKQIAGAIVLVRMGTPNLQQLFSLGAIGVVAIDDPANGELALQSSDQWQVARMFTEAIISSPRAWLPRATAEANNLLDGKPHPAELTIDVRWRDTTATTIWAMIPAAPGANDEHRRQVIVLTAELATSGAVPDATPGGRQAANCALLADMAKRLQKKPGDRPVLVVFLGSHYAAQDGARLLAWLIQKVHRGAAEPDQLSDRQTWANDQRTVCDTRLRLLQGDDLLTQSSDDAAWLRIQMRRVLAGHMSDLNYQFRQANLAAGSLTSATDATTRLTIETEQQRLKIALEQGNNDRRQLFERVLTDHVGYRRLCAALITEIAGLRASLDAELRYVQGWLKLQDALTGNAVIAQLGVDFANAQSPWYPNPFGLSSRTVWASDWGRSPRPNNFAKNLTAYQKAWDSVAADLPNAAPLRCPSATTSWTFEALSTPGRRQVACSAALGLGLMGAQLSTIGDSLPNDELPHDPAPDLAPLAAPLTTWLNTVLAADLPLRTGVVMTDYDNQRLVWRWKNNGWDGLRVDQLAPGSNDVEGPAEGALVYVGGVREAPEAGRGAVVCGRANIAIGRVNPVGYLFMPNVSNEGIKERLNALDFNHGPMPARYYKAGQSGNPFNIRLFTGWGNGMYLPFSPLDYNISGKWDRRVGRTDSIVKRSFGDSNSGGAVVVSDDLRPLKLIGNGLTVLGGTDRNVLGAGIPITAQSLLSFDILRESAEDTARLNRQRLAILRSKDLVDRPVERVNAACSTQLRQAEAARVSGDVRAAAAHDAFAAVLAHRAQEPLRASANDLLKAVVILLLLAIPFAFVVERLVFAATSIYKQIAGFLSVFLTTFGLLYVTHPAFALADAPLIIFLAFIIILLSAFVINVVMGKFKQEIRALQGLSAAAHANGSGGSTTLSAIIIGIAGMRNRPLKTFLTVATVTLLTFTILVFASFGGGYAVVESWVGKARGADRLEVHQRSLLTIPTRLVEAIEQTHEEHFDIYRRSASFLSPLNPPGEGQSTNVVLEPLAGRSCKLEAVLGLDPREALKLNLLPQLQESVPGGAFPLWLSPLVANQLNLKAGAAVRIRGQAFTFAGTFDEAVFKNAENLDGSRLTPPDFTATFASRPPKEANFAEAFETFDVTSFIFSSPSLTAVTVNAGVQALGGNITHLSLYPRNGQIDLGRHAAEIAAVFNGPVFGSTGAGIRSWWYTREITGTGFGDLLVPLLMGGLIIFSGLLGSIVDRQKEIFTYSALGLSPRDVGMLFFAESAVVAIIGGMGGYLTGQLMAKILNLLANRGLLAVPDLNFSSLTSLATILVVMLLVMASTIYPAITAGRSANPGVNRSWKMPKPHGNMLTFSLPFTVPRSSFGGIVAFIAEHFRNHGDAALDVFATRGVELFEVDAERIGIRAEVSLAPFDLGVFQRFTMTTKASDINGIDEVDVVIERTNGAPGTWLRGNLAFIADLREQFLLWRSLSPETVAHYQEQARVQAAGHTSNPASAVSTTPPTNHDLEVAHAAG